MKKFCISIGLILIIVLSAAALAGSKDEPKANAEYLRIHVRANSNTEEDQSIKYEIKDLVVSYLTKIVLESETKEQLVSNIEAKKSELDALIGAYLKQKGFTYGARTKINNELFPTRTYEDLTLEYGYYDAVIVELGSGEGDNWWCVVYPPLCFTKQKDAVYRSLIYEYIKGIYEKNDQN